MYGFMTDKNSALHVPNLKAGFVSVEILKSQNLTNVMIVRLNEQTPMATQIFPNRCRDGLSDIHFRTFQRKDS